MSYKAGFSWGPSHPLNAGVVSDEWMDDMWVADDCSKSCAINVNVFFFLDRWHG